MATDTFVQIGTAIMRTNTDEVRIEPLYTKANPLQKTKQTDGAECSGSVAFRQFQNAPNSHPVPLYPKE